MSKVVRQLRPLLAIKGKLRLQKYPGGGGGTHQSFIREALPRGPTTYPNLYTIFMMEKVPLRILLIDKWCGLPLLRTFFHPF